MWSFRRRLAPTLGGHEVADARLLADAMPGDSTSLDARTIDDLELGEVFTVIDRTQTITGAQVLWRWLVAPSQSVEALAAREAAIASVGDVSDELGTSIASDPPELPRLLWGEPVTPVSGRLLASLIGGLVACLALAPVLHVAILGALLLLAVNVFVDDWSKLRIAHASRGLELLDDLLARAAALAAKLPALAKPIADDLAVRKRLRRRLAVLRAKEPFDLLDFLRAVLLVRLAITRSCFHIIDEERDRLRRVVLWFGEIDALASIGKLRAERATCVPEVVAGPPMIVARDLVHPAIANAIGNDVALAASGLLVTGSNMSGKSTLLRTIAVNAILAQSIHTTFGAWRASPLHVRSVMRIADDPARGMSTYAVEVAAMRELVTDDRACLFAIDEPFNGTNPAVRVPIVVAVLDYLVTRGLVVAATHDLDVANRLDRRFARAYFEERDGAFDRRLHDGIAPATNAVEILLRADYPAAITNRLGGSATPA